MTRSTCVVIAIVYLVILVAQSALAQGTVEGSLKRPHYTVPSKSPWTMELQSAEYATRADSGNRNEHRLCGTNVGEYVALVFRCAPISRVICQPKVAEAIAEPPTVKQISITKIAVFDWAGNPTPTNWWVFSFFDGKTQYLRAPNAEFTPETPLRVAFIGYAPSNDKLSELTFNWEGTNTWTIPFPYFASKQSNKPNRLPVN